MLTVPAGWVGEYVIQTVVILGIGRDIVTIMAEECTLCRLASGVCTVGMRKSHVRTDPACRLHGVTSAATASPKARSRSPPQEQRGGIPSSTTPTGGGSSSSASTRPLSEMTGFRTRKGVVLLYDPEPLDAWINREIEETEEGEYVDTDTSKALTKQEGPQYRAFLQRHESRNEDARQADKLFHIVDKYLPLQADETRAGARFPARARTLLPKARKIRNRPRCGKGRDPTTRGIPSKGDSTRTTTSPGEDLLPLTEKTTHCGIERATTMSRKDSRLREGETIPTTKDAPSQGDSSRPAAEVRGGLPPPAERADVETEERATTVSRKDSRLREGTKDAPSQGDSSRPAAELHGELPPPAERADVETEHANMEGKGSPPPDGDTPPDWGDDSQTDDDITHSNWPWGEQGRPSDHGRSEGVLGQQPDEPVGRPQSGGVRLLPNRMWQAIREVQSHMERARRHRGGQ